MDVNLLQWEMSKWVINNVFDIAFWLALVHYVSRSVLEGVPSAKANTGFQAFCNVIDSLNAGVKNLMEKKGERKA